MELNLEYYKIYFYFYDDKIVKKIKDIKFTNYFKSALL